MKNVTLTRNGQTAPRDEEVSTMHADGLKVGDTVMLRIKGDCCYGKATPYKEYVVAEIKPTNRFDGKSSDVKFVRADKRVKRGGAEVVPVKSQDAQVAEQLTTQYRAVVAATGHMLREAVKFGAMLIELETIVGKSQGGFGSEGNGIKAWLETHCPEVSYANAIRYKSLASKAATLIGGQGLQTIAALQGGEKITKTNGEVIDVPAKIIEERDALFDAVDSRRKLEQAYFAFMAENDGGKAKRKQPKGLAKSKLKGGEEEEPSPEDQALVTWDEPMKLFITRRGIFYASAKLLPVNAAENFKDELESLVKVLKKRVEEA